MAAKKTKKAYKIVKKRSGRYSVVAADGKYINGEEKVKVLSKEGLLKLAAPKKAPGEDAPAAEAPKAES